MQDLSEEFESPEIEGVYEQRMPLVFKTIMELGLCCAPLISWLFPWLVDRSLDTATTPFHRHFLSCVRAGATCRLSARCSKDLGQVLLLEEDLVADNSSPYLQSCDFRTLPVFHAVDKSRKQGIIAIFFPSPTPSRVESTDVLLPSPFFCSFLPSRSLLPPAGEWLALVASSPSFCLFPFLLAVFV